jgi:acyl carrier protein
MTRLETIERRVKEIVRDHLSPGVGMVGMDFNFEAHGDADSLDKIGMLMALEEEFETDIPDEDAEKLLTVQNVVDYIDREPRVLPAI